MTGESQRARHLRRPTVTFTKALPQKSDPSRQPVALFGRTRIADAQAVTQQTIDSLSSSGQEAGLQVAAYLHGEPVVNACAGLADAVTGRSVDEQTLFNSWSTGKGSTSTVVHALAEGGLLDYDAPIADYRPEFRAHGKPLTRIGGDAVTSRVAARAPTVTSPTKARGGRRRAVPGSQ